MMCRRPPTKSAYRMGPFSADLIRDHFDPAGFEDVVTESDLDRTPIGEPQNQ